MLAARRMGAWVTGAALYALAAVAHAAVSVPAGPRGFADPSAEAQARADAWGAAVGGQPAQVFATEGDDGYAETLAIIEVDGALPPNLERDPGAALLDAFGDALAQTEPPVEAEVRLDEEGNAGPITGRFEGEDETWFVALASGGPNHARVILAVQTDEAALYENTFDGIVADLQGVAPPLPPFKISRWRIGIAGGWVAFVSVAWMFLARLREDDTVRDRARKVAGACAVAAVVAFVIAWLALDKSMDALALSGLGRAWVAAEAALLGIIAAVVALAAGAIREAQVRPIQSAPEGGAFGRHRPLPARPITGPLEMAPAAVDGPSKVDGPEVAAADETAARPPGPTETTFRGVPPPPPPPPRPKRS